MKRLALIFSFALLLAAPLAMQGQSSAVDIFKNSCDKFKNQAQGQGTAAPSVCQDVTTPQSDNPIVHILKAAIEVVSYIVGIAAVIGLLASSIKMITANGDANSVASARTGLIYSLIGIAVVSIAQGIVVFVLNKV